MEVTPLSKTDMSEYSISVILWSVNKDGYLPKCQFSALILSYINKEKQREYKVGEPDGYMPKDSPSFFTLQRAADIPPFFSVQ